jgi:acetyltransferase-like isoleucine patch superfamily enzyme
MAAMMQSGRKGHGATYRNYTTKTKFREALFLYYLYQIQAIMQDVSGAIMEKVFFKPSDYAILLVVVLISFLFREGGLGNILKETGMKVKLKLGKNVVAEKNVILGYLPSRKITDLLIVIGDNAKVRTGSIIYAGSRIGSNLDCGHNVVIREENKIGDGFSIWSNSVIDYGCTIGSNVKIHCNVYVAQFTSIEDDAFLAPGVIIANDPHPVCGDCMKGPTIGKGARIGVNVTILPRVEIGERSLIGAGSVVTKDVPAETVVAGNPARVIGSIYDLECRYGDKGKAYAR